jgi:hypothetical protein
VEFLTPVVILRKRKKRKMEKRARFNLLLSIKVY